MKFRIQKVDDIEEMRELHKLAFEGDPWPGDDHHFWVARTVVGNVAGFCSAVVLKGGAVFLSRAAVISRLSGTGLHRKLIKTRIRWAKQIGAHLIVTHVSQYNYPSMVNLIDCRFRFTRRDLCPADRYYRNFHFMHFLIAYFVSDGDIKNSQRLTVS
jgi:GNAT superfamily N-acetyltransferase